MQTPLVVHDENKNIRIFPPLSTALLQLYFLLAAHPTRFVEEPNTAHPSPDIHPFPPLQL